jgi:hypothetical protein
LAMSCHIERTLPMASFAALSSAGIADFIESPAAMFVESDAALLPVLHAAAARRSESSESDLRIAAPIKV